MTLSRAFAARLAQTGGACEIVQSHAAPGTEYNSSCALEEFESIAVPEKFSECILSGKTTPERQPKDSEDTRASYPQEVHSSNASSSQKLRDTTYTPSPMEPQAVESSPVDAIHWEGDSLRHELEECRNQLCQRESMITEYESCVEELELLREAFQQTFWQLKSLREELETSRISLASRDVKLEEGFVARRILQEALEAREEEIERLQHQLKRSDFEGVGLVSEQLKTFRSGAFIQC